MWKKNKCTYLHLKRPFLEDLTNNPLDNYVAPSLKKKRYDTPPNIIIVIKGYSNGNNGSQTNQSSHGFCFLKKIKRVKANKKYPACEFK